MPLLARSMGKRNAEAAMAFYFLASFFLFAFACGKPGSSYNYFLESGIGLALVIPAALHSLCLRHEIEGYHMFVALLILAVAVNLKSLHGIVNVNWSASIDHEGVSRTLSTVRIPSGTYVMADAAYVMDGVQSVPAPLINDNYLYSLMVINGKIYGGQIMRDLTRVRVSLAILSPTPDHTTRVP